MCVRNCARLWKGQEPRRKTQSPAPADPYSLSGNVPVSGSFFSYGGQIEDKQRLIKSTTSTHFQMIHLFKCSRAFNSIQALKKKNQRVPNTKSLFLKDNLSGTNLGHCLSIITCLGHQFAVK